MEKASLVWWTIVPPMGGKIDCQFNPSSLSISKKNTWKGDPSTNFNAPYLRFTGGSNATYSLNLFFDSYAGDKPADSKKSKVIDVRKYTNKLLQLSLRGAGYAMFKLPYASPPTVKLVWGKIVLFSAVVEAVSITYTMFHPDGYPIRAKAKVDFIQNDFIGMSDDLIPAQNPTSRTDARKTRHVYAGQRLDQIAYEEYGDARHWRTLAEANHLDDPFNLDDGQLLVIPQID
jgi:nucleoid-associated protein YgaU